MSFRRYFERTENIKESLPDTFPPCFGCLFPVGIIWELLLVFRSWIVCVWVFLGCCVVFGVLWVCFRLFFVGGGR